MSAKPGPAARTGDGDVVVIREEPTVGILRALPEPTMPPQPVQEEADSITDLVAAGSNVVAVLAEDQRVERELRKMLRGPGTVVAGPEKVGTAAAVLVYVTTDAAARVAEVRRLARSDAAILALVPSASAGAAACDAGAFSWMAAPDARGDELRGLLGLALDSRAAKTQSADLLDKLRNEAHLASIGRISAGLTHELASPVGSAILNFEHVRDAIGRLTGPSPDADLAGALDDLGASLARIRSLMASLRPAVRGEAIRLESIALHRTIDEVLGAASDVLATVQVEKVVEPLWALGEPTMLRQILLNLTSNAAQAAGSLPSARVRLHVYRSNDRAVVSVRDNGPGIPEEFHDKIFEPFFTTRRDQGGTGLGLALCREYARQMDASLSIRSTPGRGACFRLVLRLA